MRARKATNADLDALLDRLGLVRRSILVDHGRGDGGNDANGAVPDPAPARRLVPGYVYEHAETGARLMLPVRPPDEVVAAHYLHAARRTLVDWGVISDEEFDRWLCQVRFPDAGAEPATASVGQVRTTG